MPRMGGARSSTVNGTGKVIEDDHHHHGFTALLFTPTFFTFVVCAVAWWIFSQLQIAATEQAVLGFLQSTIAVTPGMTTVQMKQLMDGNLHHDMVIATGIGWAVQLQILLLAFPLDRALLAAHLRDTTPISASVGRKANMMAKGQKYLAIALIVADVVTDFMYVVQGKILETYLGFIPASGSTWGVVVIGLIYPAAICSVTVFFGLQAAHRLEALLYQMFPRKNEA